MSPDLFDYVGTFSAPITDLWLRYLGSVKVYQININKNVLSDQEILLRFSLILSSKVCLLRENFNQEGLIVKVSDS